MNNLTSCFDAPIRTVAAVVLATAAIATLAACGADADATSGAGDASVEFVGVTDGGRVAGPLDVTMVANGVVVEPAGEIHHGAGHFHIVTQGGCVPTGDVIPKDATSLHFGDGSATTELALAPGSYDLCLQFGNGEHVATELTDTVSVVVGIESFEEWCAVADHVDKVTEAVEPDSVDFAAKQAAYGKAAKYLDQLIDGIDVVDEAQRDNYRALFEVFAEVAAILVDAPDLATAEPLMEAALNAAPESSWEAAEQFEAECEFARG